MTIGTLIRDTFPEGLAYDDAAQLCLMLYSFSVLPDDLMCQCTKENLPLVFSDLVSTGFIQVPEVNTASRYGAFLHDPKDKGHWIEVIASIFKIGNTTDLQRGKNLTNRLARRLQQIHAEP